MTFSILGLTGYGYGLVAGLSALAYLSVAGVLAFRRRLPAGAIRLYGLLGVPLALIFARLAFCAVNITYFTDSISQPEKMLAFWDGGYSMVGMFCGLILAAFWVSRIQRIRFGAMLDVTAAPMGVLIFGLRLAEGLTGQLGVGRQVNVGAFAQKLPWLFLEDHMGTLTLYRLAVYRYEAVAALVVLALTLCLFFGRHPKRRARPGDLAMIFYALYGASQVLLESLRDDGHMLIGFIRAQQLGCVLMPILALAIFSARYAHIRETRKATAAAWILLPVAAVVIWMMARPINHVLDLTGKLGLGFGILAALAVYMGFFLRVKGADLRLIALWLVTLIAVATCVMVEFSIDGSDNLVRDYTVMAVCCLLLFLAPFSLWRTLKSGVYREESISVHITRGNGSGEAL